MIAPPPPGIYYDVADATYHSWQAVSNSGLGQWAKSPKHLEAFLKGALGNTDSPRLAFGRAVHVAVLQPHLFNRFFAVGPTNGRTKEGRARLKEIRESGRTALYADQWDAIRAIRENIYGHPRMQAIVSSDSKTEVSITWVDKETGVKCKTRLDLLSPVAGGIVADLKTTQDASRDAFMKSIARYGYYRQGAFNLRGCQAVGLDIAHWMLLAIETEAPHMPALYRLRDEAILAGDEEIGRALRGIRDCFKSGVWPGYGDTVNEIDLPGWKYRQLEDAAWAAEG
jgi:hypothetical protein